MSTKIMLSVMAVFLLFSTSFSQEKDSLVQLTEALGDTINSFENEYYNLYPAIGGFEYAVLYLRDSRYLVTKIAYSNTYGLIKDTLIIQNASLLGNYRAYIRQIDLEKSKSADYFSRVTISTKDGREYEGELLSVRDDGLLISGKDFEIKEGYNDLENNVSFIAKEEIQSMLICGESNILSGLGIGALTGLLIGVVGGFIDGDDPPGFISFSAWQKAVILGGGLAVVGGLVGLIIGITTSTGDEVIDVNSDYDFTELRKYLEYPSIEPQFLKDIK